MKFSLITVLMISVCLGGCSASDVPVSNKQGLTGADRDQHGCIPSAGYQWCALTNQCERPWQLAKAKGFDNSQEQFQAYCNQ